MDNKNIYELELHESTYIPDAWTTIVRVPGGWIYAIVSDAAGEKSAPVFIPYSREFMETPKAELKGDLAKSLWCKRCKTHFYDAAFVKGDICANCADHLRDEEKAERAMEVFA